MAGIAKVRAEQGFKDGAFYPVKIEFRTGTRQDLATYKGEGHWFKLLNHDNPKTCDGWYHESEYKLEEK